MKSNLHKHIFYGTNPEQINSPVFYDCVIHIICLSGRGNLSYNNQYFSIKEGQIAVLSFPRYARLTSLSKDFSCEYIAAPDKFLNLLLPANNYSIQGRISLFSNPIMDVTEEESKKFRTDILYIRQRMNDTDHRFYTEMIGSLFQTMIYDLFNFHARLNESILTTDRVGYVTSHFFTLIESGKPKMHREVSYYADQLNVSQKYLSDTIKRITGESVSSHINRAATTIIMEYLKDNRMSVSQIADSMNFTSLSYFSRYCRKHLGMSPTQFRTAGVKHHD